MPAIIFSLAALLAGLYLSFPFIYPETYKKLIIRLGENTVLAGTIIVIGACLLFFYQAIKSIFWSVTESTSAQEKYRTLFLDYFAKKDEKLNPVCIKLAALFLSYIDVTKFGNTESEKAYEMWKNHQNNGQNEIALLSHLLFFNLYIYKHIFFVKIKFF